MNTSSEVVSDGRRDVLLKKIERVTEIPLMLLSLLMIPLLVGPFLWHMSDGEETTFLIIDIFIWLLFAVDMAVKVTIPTLAADPDRSKTRTPRATISAQYAEDPASDPSHTSIKSR